jgi:hypothetical protein
MPDYTKIIIYKLINYDYLELVYVGSTTNFTNRKRHHKESCLNEISKEHKFKIYVLIREYGGWENWNMIRICDYPCNNKTEADQEEDKCMMELKANMNSKKTSRRKQEYRDDNKDKIKEYNKNIVKVIKIQYMKTEKRK